MPDLLPEITAALLATTVALWACFAFFLGPALWQTKRWAFVVDLTLAGIGFGWLFTRFLASGWLGTPENATTVEALAAAAQAIFAVALIVLTVLTVRANARMAEETSVMARETEKIAAAAVQQQVAATRPVLVFRIHPPEGQEAPDAHHFAIEVVNVGAGPALDTRVFYSGPFMFAEPTDYVQPLAIAPGEAPWFHLKLGKDSPMLDPADSLCWPRTAEDAALMQEEDSLRATPSHMYKGTPENLRIGEVRRNIQRRSNRYLSDLTARIADRRDMGQTRAQYRDLSGAVQVSTADLLVINPKSRRAVEQKAVELAARSEDDVRNFYPYWPDLMLGPLSVTAPRVLPGIDEGATESAPS